MTPQTMQELNGPPQSKIRVCPLCGGTAAKTAVISDRYTPANEPYQVVSCNQCDLLYTRPEPTLQQLSLLYSEEFYGGNPEPALLSLDTARWLLQQLVLPPRRAALLDRKPGRVLDVGCGDGQFLADLKKRGWDVYGVEFSATGCNLARTKGINVHHGELRKAAFPDKFFDVVTAWHVLEHLSEPTVDLAEMQRILRDDGLLAVEVPNSSSLTFKLCRERWWQLDIPRHLQHYTPATLQKLLQQTGFTVLRRQNFHLVDFMLAAISFMERLNILGRREDGHYLLSAFRKADLTTRILFLTTAVAVTPLCLPYSALATAFTGHSESVTITARKSKLA